jgi:ABC-2 type transport system ATP-binding protein
VSGTDLRNRIDELLTFTQLGPARERLAARLSGGMRQKLGIAMALLPRPPLVVLDEPTTGLDPVSRAEIWMMIGSAASDGAGVMVNTSYVDEAERGARVLALEAGSMLAHGTIAEFRRTIPGQLADGSERVDGRHSWRRGRKWRTWYPDGVPPGVESVEPDLSDLLIVATLRRREEGDHE